MNQNKSNYSNHGFRVEVINETHERLVLEIEKGKIKPEQLGIWLEFIKVSNPPEVMSAIHYMLFQSLDDSNSTLTSSQKFAIEHVLNLLVELWKTEKS